MSQQAGTASAIKLVKATVHINQNITSLKAYIIGLPELILE